jgi:hypothetical protein
MMLDAPVRRDWKWPFWTVLVLAVPSFAALLITVSTLIRPNIWAWALIPLLFFYAPVGLGAGAVVAAVTRNHMRRRWSRNTWIVLATSLFAGLTTLALLTWAGRQAR